MEGVSPCEQCAAIIPCWNESAAIGPLVRRVRAQVAEVIVVDDGSTDMTAELALTAGARVERHDRRRGKGAALHTGLERAWKLGSRWAITLDGDGQHSPEQIPGFLQRAHLTGAMLVVGNRMTGAAAMPRLRRLVNRWMSRQLSRRTNRCLPDSQCGFRLLRLDAWAQLPIQSQHFEVESETLLTFIAAGFRVEFLPVPVIPASRPSRIHVLPDTWRWFRWLRQSRQRTRPPTADVVPLPT